MGLENPLHILILLVVVLLVFGARRLPELGHSLGSGMRGFKDALTGDAPGTSLTVGSDEQALVAAAPSSVTAPAPAAPGAPKARS